MVRQNDVDCISVNIFFVQEGKVSADVLVMKISVGQQLVHTEKIRAVIQWHFEPIILRSSEWRLS